MSSAATISPQGQYVNGPGGNLARRRYQKGSLIPSKGLPAKDGVWVGRWREDVLQRDGSVKRTRAWEVLGSLKDYPTRRLALRALETRLSTINSPTYRARPTATFKEFASRWDASVLSQHKRSTQLAARSQLRKHLLPILSTFSLKDISTELLQARVIRDSSVSPKTTKNLVATLRMMWNSARAWGYVAYDPFDGLVLPKARRAERFFFTLDEVQRIIAAAPEPYKTFYWLAAETGMRAGELCGLRMEDVDVEACTVRVWQSVWRGGVQTPKSSNGIRSFALSPSLGRHLASYLSGWRPNVLHLLFATSNGTPWDANLVVKRKLRPLLAKLGIQRCGLHAFRHCNSSLMDRMNTPMKVRQERLGHSSGTAITMDVYTHMVSEDDRRIAAQLGNLLDANGRNTQNEGPALTTPALLIQ